jgi:hypothetical protein
MKSYNEILGFFNYEKLYYDQVNNSQDNDIFVEIGSLYGRSIIYLGQVAKKLNKNIKIHGVDYWDHRGVPELLTPGADMAGLFAGDDTDCLYNYFLNNLKECDVNNIITPHRMSSEEGSKQFKDNSIDFAFIDAGHTYEDVNNDLKCWFPKIKPGKVIAGHDYDWEGVKKAVDEFFGEENIQVYNTSWFYTKPTKDKYTFIIPYRNREEHLSILLPRLSSKLKFHNYEIIIAEQDDNEKFRLSSLYNIAYKYSSGDIIVFHDVDYIPTNNVNYQLKNNNPTYPVRQVIFLDSDLNFKDIDQIPAGYRHFKDDVGNHWGGVFMLHKNHFESINGFNPLYIGWGKEEEETHLRLLEKGLICERNNEGLFYALEHKDNCPHISDHNFIENHHLLNDYKNNLHIGYQNITANIEEYNTEDSIKWLKIKNFKYENIN